MRAFVFPGQGSQYIGMGKELYENFPIAKQIFDEVDNALNQKLYALMSAGNESDLNLTENTQPALMAVSIATTRVLETETGKTLSDLGAYVAGHSLGEYSALTAVNALTLPDCAKLLKLRGQAMQRAVPVGMGAMAAILGLSFDEVMEIAAEASAKADGDNMCQAANDNSDGQTVISGHKQAVAYAIEIAGTKGAKRAIELPVSAPFHCNLMEPAAKEMAAALASANIQSPSLPLIANVTAQPTQDPAQIRDYLVQQVTGTVRWRESVQWLSANGVTEIVELGANKVLTGLTRRINKDISATFAETPDQISTLIETL